MRQFIANLTLARKFALIGAIAALMLALPSLLVVRANLTKLQAANEQLAGIAPARAAIDVLHYMQQHRGLSAVVLGGRQRFGERQAVQATRGRQGPREPAGQRA